MPLLEDVEIDDLYQGVEFFEQKEQKEQKVKSTEDQSEEKKELNNDPSNEGECVYYDATDSEGESIEKSTGKSEEKYNAIIRSLENKLTQESKSKKAGEKDLLLDSSPGKGKSRFGWLWGGEIPESQGNQLEVKIRKRSNTISKNGGGSDDDIPVPQTRGVRMFSKSESGISFPSKPNFNKEKNDDLESQESDEQKLKEVQEGLDSPPRRKGLFRRFMGLFSGRRDGETLDKSKMFSIEKVPPKKGDFGDFSPKATKSFKRDVGMSLCKNKLFTCEKDEVNDVFNDNEVSYEDF